MGVCASSSSVSNKKECVDYSKMITKLRIAFWQHKVKEETSTKSQTKNEKKQSSNTHSSFNLTSQTDSKEETYFDSKAWLDSDSDGDFVSVKGDFTPSQGNTPVHHNFSIGTLHVHKSFFNDSSPEPSPNKKKRLSELLQESLREDKGADFQDHNNENMGSTKAEIKSTTLGLPPRSVNGTTMLKEKTVKSSQCCLPMMLSNRSFNERSKTSPAQSFG